jgi:hypothetical protein
MNIIDSLVAIGLLVSVFVLWKWILFLLILAGILGIFAFYAREDWQQYLHEHDFKFADVINNDLYFKCADCGEVRYK